MKLNRKLFLVTGAASGLGLATTKLLLEKGAKVIMLDVQESVLQTASELNDDASALVADVTNEQALRHVMSVAKQRGGLYGVVHCAGMVQTQNLIDDNGQASDTELFRKIVDINTLGTFNILRLASETMLHNPPSEEGERGVIVTTASICAQDGGAGQCAYAASKAAVIGMVLPAARELGTYGIRVMSVAPGPFATAMLADKPAEHLEAAAQVTPFPKRLGAADDFASLAAHVIENVMLNGETIRIDGGMRLR